VDIYLLDKDFVEEEVTWEVASEGSPWTTPGGAGGSATLLGNFQFTGTALDTVAIDTVVVRLDSLAMDQFVRSGLLHCRWCWYPPSRTPGSA